MRTVVSQRPTESLDALVERTVARLGELEEGGRGIGLALLACGQSTDDEAVLSRAKLADVILEHLPRERSAHLVLAARPCAGSKLRDELVSLADHAITTMGASGGNVSIWFGDVAHV
jgi:hypothetical protein